MQANWIGKSHGVRFAFHGIRGTEGEMRGKLIGDGRMRLHDAPHNHGRHLRGRGEHPLRARPVNFGVAAFVDESRPAACRGGHRRRGEEGDADGLFVTLR
jgi:hypothetical protein